MKDNQATEQQPDISTAQEGKPSRKLAFASLILGIASIFFLAAGGLLGLPAVICGHKALSRIKKFPAQYEGRGMAIIGLILGYITSMITLAMVTYLILGMLDIVHI